MLLKLWEVFANPNPHPVRDLIIYCPWWFMVNTLTWMPLTGFQPRTSGVPSEWANHYTTMCSNRLSQLHKVCFTWGSHLLKATLLKPTPSIHLWHKCVSELLIPYISCGFGKYIDRCCRSSVRCSQIQIQPNPAPVRDSVICYPW